EIVVNRLSGIGMRTIGHSVAISPAWFTRLARGGVPSWYAGSTAGSRARRRKCEQLDSIPTPPRVSAADGSAGSARGQGGHASAGPIAGGRRGALGSGP